MTPTEASYAAFVAWKVTQMRREAAAEGLTVPDDVLHRMALDSLDAALTVVRPWLAAREQMTTCRTIAHHFYEDRCVDCGANRDVVQRKADT